MNFLGSIRWIALALVGLAVAAGVSLAASQLVSERIGLAAEPVSAGKNLAPGHDDHHAGTGDARHPRNRGGGTSTSPPSKTTTPAPSTTVPAPSTSPSTTAPPSSSGNGSRGEHEGADD
jgi:hypothetical protein